MGLLQVGASILTSLLIGALTSAAVRRTRFAQAARTYLLLAFSILAVYWFQPLVPLRSFDFWLPSLTLALIVLIWFITSANSTHTQADSTEAPVWWRSSSNLIALAVIIGLPVLIDLSRYFLAEPLITAEPPPRFSIFFVFVLALAVTILLTSWLSRRFLWVLSAVIIFLILILVLLKTPALSLQASVFVRALTHRPTENAAFTDLRWLGFSYIAFRLIHVLRDKQAGRLPP